jgi:hypothetical protein
MFGRFWVNQKVDSLYLEPECYRLGTELQSADSLTESTHPGTENGLNELFLRHLFSLVAPGNRVLPEKVYFKLFTFRIYFR